MSQEDAFNFQQKLAHSLIFAFSWERDVLYHFWILKNSHFELNSGEIQELLVPRRKVNPLYALRGFLVEINVLNMGIKCS